MLRKASLKERKEFYERDFDLNKVKKWFRRKPQFFVLDLGTDTKIIKDKKKLKKLIILKPNTSYEELKTKLIELSPEDVYYDRNLYKDLKKINKKTNFHKALLSDNCLGQELAFDIDPENIKCPNCGKRSSTEKYCKICINMSLILGLELKKFLKNYFKEIVIIYSGRGCHVHVRDKKAFKMSQEKRKELNLKLRRLKIDPWVSHGPIRLIRLPYSLNSLVSRIVIPLKDDEIRNFDVNKNKKIMPSFLKKQ